MNNPSSIRSVPLAMAGQRKTSLQSQDGQRYAMTVVLESLLTDWSLRTYAEDPIRLNGENQLHVSSG